MTYREIVPSAPLRPFVENFLLTNFGSREGLALVKPYPTRIEQALVFFARGGIHAYDVQTKQYSKIARNALFGQQVSRLDFHTHADPDFLMLMVVFKPGGLTRMLGLPSTELTRCFIDAESVLTSEVQHVNDRIANSKSHEAMVACVEHYLIENVRLVKSIHHPIDRIADMLIKNHRRFSLDWFSGQANLSPRQFERRFNERIGIGPKLYSRISRFSEAFLFKEANPTVDWLTISLRFGYSDYYHMVKDFKQFANTTPNIILQEYARRPEVVLRD